MVEAGGPVVPREVDVLLVGGGVASVRCARTLRRNGFAGSILLVADERTLPYNRPPLSKELLRDDLPEELVLAEQAAWYERQRVEVLRATTVTALDLAKRTVELWDGGLVRYGRCLLATGAAPRTLPVPGGATVPTLRTLADARRVRRSAQDGAGRGVTIIGGGLIGVEVASSLATIGARPTLLVRDRKLWGGALGAVLSDWGLERLAAAGVEVGLETDATEIVEGRVRTRDGELPGRLVLAGIGVEPRTGLAESAGLEVADGIVVDGDGRTSDGAVWAAGDVARAGPTRVEHWHNARESGERAARSMLGLPSEPPRAPWTFSEVGGTPLDVVGNPADRDSERWISEGVLAYLSGRRVIAVAIVASALDPARARELVVERASVPDLERAVARV